MTARAKSGPAPTSAMGEPDHAPLYHGGDIGWAVAQFGGRADQWLDLSTGISPWGYPVDVPSDSWRKLPDSSVMAALEQCARQYYRVNGEAGLVAAPGSQLLIRLLPRLFPPATRVAIIEPSYAEHTESWRLSGHDVVAAGNIDAIDPTAPVVVVSNPNNPDARQVAPDALRALAKKLQSRSGFVIIDEAFCDLTPDLSLTSEAGTAGAHNIFVLRSLGKFFGLAGARAGFGIGSTELCGKLEDAMGPWAVPHPTARLAAKALGDNVWVETTKTRIAEQSGLLDRALTKLGIDIIGSAGLFRLIRLDAAHDLFEFLARRHILTRHFKHQPGWLRLGLPGSEADQDRLLAALRDWMNPAD